MKIVCDACQAKYSISDDKVQGKVFKIRCKKCSNIIVVRGGANAAEAAPAPAPEAAARVYDYNQGGDQAPSDDDAVWHVVINQDQVGPMTASEVQQRFAAGEIDAETYAWREGFADWLPLAQVDAFATFVASGSTTAAADSGGGAAAVSSMFGGGGGDEAGTMRSDPGDLFATAGKGAALGGGGGDDDHDLFGSKPSAAAAAAASKEKEAKLRGERNENSVLFSLNNLAQLASDKPAPAKAASSTPGAAPAGHATGAAGGEGSGLIDIRSMANAYLGGGGAGAAKPAAASSGIGSIDDLPVFGGGGFSEPAVIVPVAARSSGGNNKMMYALIGSVGVLALAAVILVVVMLKGGDKPATVAANDADKAAAKATDGDDKDADKPSDKDADKPADGDAKPADPKPEDGATIGSKPADTATDAKPADTRPADTKPADKPADKPRDKPTSTTSSSSSSKPSSTTAKPAETKPAETASSGGCDEVSCVLNNYEGACCAKYKKAKAGGGAAKPSGGGAGLPDALDRAMISDGVNKVKPRVMACGDKSSAKGQVKVSVKVSPGGSVESASVKATPDPALGNCVAAAMQKATFAKTANGGSFSYPFVF